MLTHDMDKQRPTYARVDLAAFGRNIDRAKKLSGSDIIAVIKADAYGHGAARLADYAYKKHDVKNFDVATIAEGIFLRKIIHDPDVRIMVLGYVDEKFYPDVTENNLCLSLFDENSAASYYDYLESRDIFAQVALEIDTGMGRLGFSHELDLYDFIKRFPRFKITHVMSHLATSGTDPEYAAFQESLFKIFLEKHIGFAFDTSLYNSGAILNHRNIYPFTRPGILLYDNVMSIHSKVVRVQKLRKGQSVSYNRLFKADGDCWVGVVPIGYADGYSRGLSNKGRMYISDICCPVLGAVCMDMTMIDVTPLAETAYGQEVEVMGANVPVSDIAKTLNTIEYEVFCGISGRVPRVYV